LAIDGDDDYFGGADTLNTSEPDDATDVDYIPPKQNFNASMLSFTNNNNFRVP
jgi:hypothetical protein